MTRIEVPDPGLVLLVGPAGAGKTTFARSHFGPTEVVSSDACRALVADDENDQSATAHAFRLLDLITELRLVRRRLTVVDATNVDALGRQRLLQLARDHDLPCVAIVFDRPLEVCLARARARLDRRVTPGVVRRQHARLQRSPPGGAEGFERIWVLRSGEDESTVQVVRRAVR